MRLVKWFIVQASLLAVVLSLSLSGYGMVQAHASMTLDAATMDHSDHYMSHADHQADHQADHGGHSNCPMIACCHIGGVDAPEIPALTDTTMCRDVPVTQRQVHKAEPESAKKPPRHT